jgi:hypothetical protein
MGIEMLQNVNNNTQFGVLLNIVKILKDFIILYHCHVIMWVPIITELVL